MPIKKCPVCHKIFKGRKKTKTCSCKCGQKLRFEKSQNTRKQQFIKHLNKEHPDITYISGYKSRQHRGHNNFKLLVKCNKTGIRYYIYASHVRIKNWKCAICLMANPSVYPQDKKKYKHYLNIKNALPAIVFEPRHCKWCGKVFSLPRLQTQVCCSQQCSKKYKNHQRQIQKDVRTKIAKKNGVYQDITLARLYKRDHGQCYICGKHLVLNNEYNRPDAPTIEHIIPISRGGTNTWDNVKLACRNCNVSKGTHTYQEYLKEEAS